jgi:hypothetical protein
LIPKHAHLQVLIYDREVERIVARGRTIPFYWGGDLWDLPHGFDAVGLRGLDDHRIPNCLTALAAEVEKNQ